MCVFISCETGGSEIPSWVNVDRSPAPASRRGAAQTTAAQTTAADESQETDWHGDTAAGFAARRMAKRLGCPLIENQYSPALIDVSRSSHNRQLFSAIPRSWDEPTRSRLIREIHAPYRRRVREQVSRMLLRLPVVTHVSVRTFASFNRGLRRRADIGLGYDPQQPEEVDFCLDWIDELYDVLPMVRVRRNYPRRGTIDSITKGMRSHFDGMNYLGIEVQLNRAWVARPLAVRDRVLDAMSESLRTITRMFQSDAA